MLKLPSLDSVVKSWGSYCETVTSQAMSYVSLSFTELYLDCSMLV